MSAGPGSPGTYYARLQVRHDTPYQVPDVPITVTVQAPASYGLLSGQVTSTGYCQTHPGPVGEAELRIVNPLGGKWTARTDRNGRYQVWLDSGLGPYTVEVFLDGYGPGTQAGVQIHARQTTNMNWQLPYLSPCVTVQPAVLFTQLPRDGKADLGITLSNAGEGSTDFQITSEGNLPGWMGLPILAGEIPAGGSIALPVRINTQGWVLSGDYTVVLNVETRDPVVPRIQIPVQVRIGNGFVYYFPLMRKGR